MSRPSVCCVFQCIPGCSAQKPARAAASSGLLLAETPAADGSPEIQEFSSETEDSSTVAPMARRSTPTETRLCVNEEAPFFFLETSSSAASSLSSTAESSAAESSAADSATSASASSSSLSSSSSSS